MYNQDVTAKFSRGILQYPSLNSLPLIKKAIVGQSKEFVDSQERISFPNLRRSFPREKAQESRKFPTVREIASSDINYEKFT